MGGPSRNKPSAAASGELHLDVVQRWFQAVITHPGGVSEGIESQESQRLIRLRRDQLEQVIRRSKNLTAHERLSIYANAYYARLLECLAECFPVLRRTVGQEVFNDFAFGYLQRYPSRSYTLSRIGDDFARYLDETRPDRGEEGKTPEVSWPDFLIDLADFEWAIGEVFDGFGPEGGHTLDLAQWQAIPPARWPAARLVTVKWLRLLRFRYPVNDYYTAVRRANEDEKVPRPDPAEQFVALSRKQYVVRRYELTQAQYLLLEALEAGQSVGAALRRVADGSDVDDEQLAASLREWFRVWTAEGFFQAVELT